MYPNVFTSSYRLHSIVPRPWNDSTGQAKWKQKTKSIALESSKDTATQPASVTQRFLIDIALIFSKLINEISISNHIKKRTHQSKLFQKPNFLQNSFTKLGIEMPNLPVPISSLTCIYLLFWHASTDLSLSNSSKATLVGQEKWLYTLWRMWFQAMAKTKSWNLATWNFFFLLSFFSCNVYRRWGTVNVSNMCGTGRRRQGFR